MVTPLSHVKEQSQPYLFCPSAEFSCNTHFGLARRGGAAIKGGEQRKPPLSLLRAATRLDPVLPRSLYFFFFKKKYSVVPESNPTERQASHRENIIAKRAVLLIACPLRSCRRVRLMAARTYPIHVPAYIGYWPRGCTNI